MPHAVDRLFEKKGTKKRGQPRKISNKIAFLIRKEGKPPKQAVAIANSLFRRREL